MNMYTDRPYSGTADLTPVLALLDEGRRGALPGRWPPLHEVRFRLHYRTSTAHANTHLWHDQHGILVAWASLWDDEVLVYAVHPGVAHPDEVLQTLLGWAAARAAAADTSLCVPVARDDTRTAQLLVQAGFTPAETEQLRMARSLTRLPAPPPLPPGFSLQAGIDTADLAAYLDLHRAVALVSSKSAGEHLARRHDPAYPPDLDLLAVATDGTFAAFCLASLDDDLHQPRRAGWIDLIGTRPALRSQGLARTLLYAALERLQARGAATAFLSTGSWNDAAQRLFTSAGFQTLYREQWFLRSW